MVEVLVRIENIRSTHRINSYHPTICLQNNSKPQNNQFPRNQVYQKLGYQNHCLHKHSGLALTRHKPEHLPCPATSLHLGSSHTSDPQALECTEMMNFPLLVESTNRFNSNCFPPGSMNGLKGNRSINSFEIHLHKIPSVIDFTCQMVAQGPQSLLA